MVFVGKISIVFMGVINQLITGGAPPCTMERIQSVREKNEDIQNVKDIVNMHALW